MKGNRNWLWPSNYSRDLSKGRPVVAVLSVISVIGSGSTGTRQNSPLFFLTQSGRLHVLADEASNWICPQARLSWGEDWEGHLGFSGALRWCLRNPRERLLDIFAHAKKTVSSVVLSTRSSRCVSDWVSLIKLYSINEWMLSIIIILNNECNSNALNSWITYMSPSAAHVE